jgi:hypothetical protein
MRKSVGQAPTAGEQTTKTVWDIFRHRSRTGKSYYRTRSDVGSERVKYMKKVKVKFTLEKATKPQKERVDV